MGINDFIQIGSRIREERVKRGYTQKQFAELAGIPYSTYSNYENNNREPGREALEKIALVLNINVCDLYENHNLRPPHTKDIFWTSYLSDKLEQINCKMIVDEEDAGLWIETPEGTLEITLKDLKELDDSTISYLQFKLEELKKRHPEDFRPKKNKPSPF